MYVPPFYSPQAFASLTPDGSDFVTNWQKQVSKFEAYELTQNSGFEFAIASE